jgi:hypothetical protein
MTDPLTSVPDADADDDVLSAFSLPEAWGDLARSSFEEVATVRPDIEGSELVALETACAMLDTAERLEAVARAAGYLSVGAAGQPVMHPFVPEARLARSQAAGIMHRLTAVATGPAMTNSQRGRVAAQARWSKAPGGRRGA